MRIAVLGSGGREHAIAWKLRQSPGADRVIVVPGNGGTEPNTAGDLSDFPSLGQLFRHEAFDLVIVGPEQPLVDGIVDYFADSGIRVFGPDRKSARLEGSKIWAKEFMQRNSVATGDFKVYGAGDEYGSIAQTFANGVVIKYDGLAAGKGVFVCDAEDEIKTAVSEIRKRYGPKADFLAEEKLSGQELSVIGFTDGRDIQLLLPSQDHKQAHDGDTGPNTGGMGAYCPVPFCDEALMERIRTDIVEPTLQGIRTEGLVYRGILYFGLMITEHGPKLLEYNVRLGDPETEVILPALESDLLPLINSCFDGNLKQCRPRFHSGYVIDVVLTSAGYPGSYEKGFQITGLERVRHDTMLFHAGTAAHGDDVITAGGRVLNVVVKAPNLKEAIQNVYDECAKIWFQGVYYRSDIGMRVAGEIS